MLCEKQSKRLPVTILHKRTGAGHEEEGGCFVESWRKDFPGRGSSLCKGPEAGTYLVCSRKPLGWRGVGKPRNWGYSQRGAGYTAFCGDGKDFGLRVSWGALGGVEQRMGMIWLRIQQQDSIFSRG